MRTAHRGAPAIAAALIAFAALTVACTSEQGSTEAFCSEVGQVPALESVLARFSEADAEVLQARIDKARSAYEDLASAAPADIEDEADEVVELVEEILQAVEDHPSDPAAAADQLRIAMEDHPDIGDARAEMAAFAQAECDVRLDPTLGGITTTTAITSTASDPPASTSTTGG